MKMNIASLFGQIEGVVAGAMAAEGKVKLIPSKDIPISARFNTEGEIAICAIIFFSKDAEAEFDDRVKNLYA